MRFSAWVGTKALRQAVRGPLEEQGRWKYQICALEGIWSVLFFMHTASYVGTHFVALVVYALVSRFASGVSRLVCKVLPQLVPLQNH